MFVGMFEKVAEYREAKVGGKVVLLPKGLFDLTDYEVGNHEVWKISHTDLALFDGKNWKNVSELFVQITDKNVVVGTELVEGRW